jgi:glycosyltransferase involved in cell wall biosynthesis
MNVGGPAVLLSELVKNLPGVEFEHILLTGTCLDNEIDFLDSHPFSSQVIYINDFQKSLLPTSDLKSLFGLVRILRKLSPELVHTHTSKAGVLGRLAIKVAAPRSKVVHTYHGHLLYGYFPKWKTRLIVGFEKFLGVVTDRYVAVTEQVKLDLLRVGIGPAQKWRVIYPGLRQKLDLSKLESRKNIGVGPQCFVISWVGRFTDIKNPMLAIQAFENVEDKNGLHLIMAGAGELLEDCKTYSESRGLPITFLGWVTDINPILSSSDLLLMTSRNEGMPVVIVESALKGIPALSTDVGGVSEFVKNDHTGWLVESNIESISEKIEYLAKNLQLVINAGDKAKDLAETDFSVENFVLEHVKLYRELLSNNSN